MKTDGKIITCPYCGGLYRFASMTVSDQSCCPRCLSEREHAADEGLPWNPPDRRGPLSGERPDSHTLAGTGSGEGE